MGHLISREGVAADPAKIECMLNWPRPTTQKGLREFLRLTRYYRKFVKNYGLICQPLTALLKKNSFVWSDEAELDFKQLKKVVTTTPVLILPDFTVEFELETDASDSGVGAVLMQQGRPIAFFSKAMGLRYKALSTYEKELLSIVMSVNQLAFLPSRLPF